MEMINNKYTEAYLQKEEAEYLENSRIVCEEKDRVLHILNEWLVEDTISAKKNILQFFKDPVYQGFIDCVEELKSFRLIVSIYEIEIKNREQNLILRKNRDLRLLLEILRSVKFLIWEIEFEINTDAVNELLQIIREFQLSNYFLAYVVMNYAVDSRKVIQKLEEKQKGHIELFATIKPTV